MSLSKDDIQELEEQAAEALDFMEINDGVPLGAQYTLDFQHPMPGPSQSKLNP